MSDKRSAILENTQWSFGWVSHILMCSFLREGWQNETCFFRFWGLIYDKKYFVPQHSEAKLAQSLIFKICFLLTCFHQMLPCLKFLKKERTKRHERFLEFCVRFASILKMSIKWNSGPRVQNNSPKTLTLLDDGMSFSGWHCTFRIAVNTVWDN